MALSLSQEYSPVYRTIREYEIEYGNSGIVPLNIPYNWYYPTFGKSLKVNYI